MKKPDTPYSFKSYWDMLDGVGPKVKDMILADAAESDVITLDQFILLNRKAYPPEE